MNENILSWLLSTGLDEQRAELYVAVLARGQASAKDVASDTGLKRTAVYDNIRALEERGYVQTIRQGKKKLFVALPPKELYAKVDQQRQQLKDLLPDFLSLQATNSKRPSVQMIDGPFGAREVYEDILKVAKKEYVYFSPPQLTLQVVDRRYIEKWIQRRVAKKLQSRSLRIKAKVIPNEAIFNDEEQYLRRVRFLPGYVDLQASIYIYANNIGVISTRREGSAFILHSPDLAFSLRQLFEFLWGISTKS